MRAPEPVAVKPSREALPDVLRALALVSVLVVNAIGYQVAPYGSPLGVRTPDDSFWAAVTQGLVAALLQGKGYTILAFVFGMALWLSARKRPRPKALRHAQGRNLRLLGLGAVHGVFIYFGDILTMYALVGRTLLCRLHMPWSRFRRHLWQALVWAVLAKVVLVTAMVQWLPGRAVVAEISSLSTVHGYEAFWKLNAGNYLANQLAGIVMVGPVLYLCMLAGVAVARLRLLTHRRWRTALQRFLRRLGAPLLALGLVYGWGCAVTTPAHALYPWLEALGDLTAIPLAAVYVVGLAVASSGGRAGWCQWLVPLGQRTLSLYVGHGVMGLLLFSGAGLALVPSTAQLVLLSLGVWALAWVAALLSGDRRWPLEAWMARR